jgi:seryl-tRNA synthetase
MIDINRIRENPEAVRQALLKRVDDVSFDELLAWDRARREAIVEGDALKARRNQVSAEIPKLKKRGEDTTAILQEMKDVSSRVKELDAERDELETKIDGFLVALPNIPAEDVPAGGKEANVFLREWGHKPEFTFHSKDHIQLVESLGLVDYERGVKMGGNGFWLYRGEGARLEWALLNFFVQEHIRDGYEFVLPPHILTYECGFTAGQFPKFAEDVFHLKPTEGKGYEQFLLPTAETALINFHRDEILPEDQLPLRYFSYTPCYRKEAGSYRTQERGMIRGHQFNKVEMFQFTAPEDSERALEELLAKAESLVQALGLHYRVSRLAARDCSASMAKTLDIEVWIPSMNEYKEISSISNAHDYQARRGNIRYRPRDSKKPTYIHSLNGSGLATSRVLPAIVEQLQTEDGSVIVPEPLRAAVGKDKLTPAS